MDETSNKDYRKIMKTIKFHSGHDIDNVPKFQGDAWTGKHVALIF